MRAPHDIFQGALPNPTLTPLTQPHLRAEAPTHRTAKKLGMKGPP